MTGLLRGRNFLPLRDMKSSYDVVIIGGGVQGLSTAYYLAAHHGIKNIAVLERAYIGAGASGRNTQVVRSNYNTPETIPSSWHNMLMIVPAFRETAPAY